MPTTTSTRNNAVRRRNRSKTRFLSWSKNPSRRSKSVITAASGANAFASKTTATDSASATNTVGTVSLSAPPFSASSSSSASTRKMEKMEIPAEDVNLPPKHIFDPPDEGEDETLSDAETYTTKESLSTVGKRQHKHPSQLNEVELRIQLWDAYRLARIILGTPIRSVTLKGKTILHSIRKVAEMKMELIRLQKEVEMSKVMRESMGELTGMPSITPSEQASSTSLAQDLNEHIASLLISKKEKQQQSKQARTRSKTPNRRTTSRAGDRSQARDEVIRTSSSDLDLKLADSGLSAADRLELAQAQYKSLQQAHQGMMNELQTQLQRMQAELAISTEAAQKVDGEEKEETAEAPTQNVDGEEKEETTEAPTQNVDGEEKEETAEAPTQNVDGEEKEETAEAPIDPTQVDSLDVTELDLTHCATDSTEVTSNTASNLAVASEEDDAQLYEQSESVDLVLTVVKEVASSPEKSANTALNLEPTQESNEDDDKSGHVHEEQTESDVAPATMETPIETTSDKVNESSKQSAEGDLSQSVPETNDSTRSDNEVLEKSAETDSSVVIEAAAHVQDDNDTVLEEESKIEAPLKISPPSAFDDTTAFTPILSPTAQELKALNEENLVERRRLQKLIEDLMEKVEKTTQETKEQFHALENQLQVAASFDSRDMDRNVFADDDGVFEDDDDDSAYMDEDHSGSGEIILTQGQFEKRLQTVHTLHALELETSKSRHTQQVVDMAGQLDAYQQQVEIQNKELHKWRRKYHHLEEMAVTPAEAQEVLAELESLTPHSTQEEHEQVQNKVVRVLQRMTHLHTRQEKERRRIDTTRKAANMREAESKEQLEFLRLQKEILEEETEVSPEEWQQQLAQQRKTFQKELKKILKEEEKRMVEMDYLEVHMTKLAFVAVEVEELEKEFQETYTSQSKIIARGERRLELTAPLMEDLKSRLKQMMERQQDSIQHLMYQQQKESPKRAEIEKLETQLKTLSNNAEVREKLSEREKELRKAKAELQASQDRVRELEAKMRELRPSNSMSNDSEAASAK